MSKLRTLVKGEVVSDKMNKSIAVLVYHKKKHTKYQKYFRKSSVFKAHDEKNEAKKGDLVLIRETRPLSKTKRFYLVEVLNKEVKK